MTREGAPPLIDVYIEDGRRGEYRYQPRYWNCRAIWNRRAADGGKTHQEPVAGAANFAYVKIKNRGRTTATGVTVKAFHSKPSAGRVYPGNWKPMTTAELPVPDVPPQFRSRDYGRSVRMDALRRRPRLHDDGGNGSRRCQ